MCRSFENLKHQKITRYMVRREVWIWNMHGVLQEMMLNIPQMYCLQDSLLRAEYRERQTPFVRGTHSPSLHSTPAHTSYKQYKWLELTSYRMNH